MMKKFVFKSKWNIAILALLGVSLISAGVFAAATININTTNQISLGAGRASVNACNEVATVNTHQDYDLGDHIYKLTSITIDNFNTAQCNGKTIKMTIDYNDGENQYHQSTSWTSLPGGSSDTLTWGPIGASPNASDSPLTAIDTTAMQSNAFIAISEE
jgi:hypothetical protein